WSERLMPISKNYVRKLKKTQVDRKEFKRYEEWGIRLLRNRWARFLSKKLLWRLTFVNSLIITAFILFAGWAIYEATCIVVDENVAIQEGKIIKDILLQYIGIFVVLFTAFVVSLQYFFTRHQLQPLRVLMESMEKLKQGKEVQNVRSEYEDEITALMDQFNDLVNQLESNKKQRHQRLSE